MKPRRLLKRIVVSPHNVRFHDLLALTGVLGFRVVRIEGSHHILSHPAIPELLNLQEVKGKDVRKGDGTERGRCAISRICRLRPSPPT